MHLTFGMAIFWLVLASMASETIIRTARARRAGRGASPDAAGLERRVGELERALAQMVEAQHAQDQTVERLREQVDFAERLLGAQQRSRSLT